MHALTPRPTGNLLLSASAGNAPARLSVPDIPRDSRVASEEFLAFCGSPAPLAMVFQVQHVFRKPSQPLVVTHFEVARASCPCEIMAKMAMPPQNESLPNLFISVPAV